MPYQRTHKGLPVYGGDFVVVTDSAGRVLSTAVAQDKVANVATNGSLTAAQAATAAKAQATGKTVDTVSSPRKVVFALEGTPRLTWETIVSSHTGAIPSKLHVFTDANTGAVAYTYDEVREGTGTGKWNGPSPLAIDTSHPTSTTWTMTDPTRTNVSCRNFSGGAVLSGSDDVWGNGVGNNIETGCVDALFDVKNQWSMLSSWLGRNGMTGSGGGLPIHVGLNDVNAYYDGTKVAVGHNNAGDWISSLDVIGHEFGHMIDDYTPGGIGSSSVAEFTGDVFGALTEAYANEPVAYDEPDYTVGEEINLVGQGPIRNMYNPSLKGDPNCYSSSIPSTETHSAAGPGNHWFYLVAEGSNPTNGQPTSPTCNSSTVTGIGLLAAGKIFYNAMLAKTTGMTYLKYRTQTLIAAKNLYPGNCTNFNTVKAAWDAVSVPAQTGDPTCSSSGTVTVTNPGSQTGTVGTAKTLQMSASGGTAPYTWSATGLPAGLSINATLRVDLGHPDHRRHLQHHGDGQGHPQRHRFGQLQLDDQRRRRWLPIAGSEAGQPRLRDRHRRTLDRLGRRDRQLHQPAGPHRDLEGLDERLRQHPHRHPDPVGDHPGRLRGDVQLLAAHRHRRNHHHDRLRQADGQDRLHHAGHLLQPEQEHRLRPEVLQRLLLRRPDRHGQLLRRRGLLAADLVRDRRHRTDRELTRSRTDTEAVTHQ